MSETRYYQDIRAIRTLESDVDVNQHLASGWELISIKSYSRKEVREDKITAEDRPIFVLGLRNSVEPNPPEDNRNQVPNFKDLPWKVTFDTEGKITSLGPMDVPQGVREFMLKHDSRHADGEYTYRLSSSGWLNRYPKEASQRSSSEQAP